MVAGYYYPRQREALLQALARLVPSQATAVAAQAIVVPHGGLAFSGSVAGRVFGRVRVPRRVILIAPNHTGLGHAWSLMSCGSYVTPLGETPIDEPLAEALVHACPLFEEDHTAHWPEHAIEAVLPFVQYAGPVDLTIVPMTIDSATPADYQEVGSAIARVIHESPEPVLLITTADFTHYQPQERVRDADQRLLASVQSLEPSRWLDQLRRLHLVTCAQAPVACALEAARRLGSTQAELVSYATSADAGGDPHSAIGYAGLVIP